MVDDVERLRKDRVALNQGLERKTFVGVVFKAFSHCAYIEVLLLEAVDVLMGVGYLVLRADAFRLVYDVELLLVGIEKSQSRLGLEPGQKIEEVGTFAENPHGLVKHLRVLYLFDILVQQFA